MTLDQLDNYFRSILDIEGCEKSDPSLNGIQVGQPEQNVETVAFAVDACLQSFQSARDCSADTLFVHHGLFWGRPFPITGSAYDRISFLTVNNISLYAAHLPLDLHDQVGNNAGMANMLGLSGCEPFGSYKGLNIGWKGTLPAAASMDDILDKLELKKQDCLALLPFGKERIETVGIISGGASHELEQAIEQKLDLYITGEASHVIYHQALENSINVICGGHYNTEVWGCRLLADKCAADTGLKTLFIDNPTGL